MRYHNVVDEVQIDFTNILDVALRLFKPGRKLKPAVRAKQAQAVESVREAKRMMALQGATGKVGATCSARWRSDR